MGAELFPLICSVEKGPRERESWQLDLHPFTWTRRYVSVAHIVCLFVYFRQSRAFVICVVPT